MGRPPKAKGEGKKAKTQSRFRRWDDTLYVEIYTLARTGLSDTAIRQALNIGQFDWERWVVSKPAIQVALRKAREPREQVFQDYVYGKLSPQTKECWDRVCLLDKVADDEYELDPFGWLNGMGKRIRQELFLFALVHCNWNPSKACTKINLSGRDYRDWLKDPEFHKLLQEMNWHKANFFEEALVSKIKEGDTNAIIFANRTMNRDRGYGDKVQVEHTGSVTHQHYLSQVDLEKLDLSLECRKEILTAIRNQRELEGKQEPKRIEYREVKS